MIQRYDVRLTDELIESWPRNLMPWPHGGLVLYADYAAEIAAKDAEIAQLADLLFSMFKWQSTINDLMPGDLGGRVREALEQHGVDVQDFLDNN